MSGGFIGKILHLSTFGLDKVIYNITVRPLVRFYKNIAHYIITTFKQVLKGQFDQALGTTIKASIFYGTLGLIKLEDKYSWISDGQFKIYNMLSDENQILYINKAFPLKAIIEKTSMSYSLCQFLFVGNASVLKNGFRWMKTSGFLSAIGSKTTSQASRDYDNISEEQLDNIIATIADDYIPLFVKQYSDKYSFKANKHFLANLLPFNRAQNKTTITEDHTLTVMYTDTPSNVGYEVNYYIDNSLTNRLIFLKAGGVETTSAYAIPNTRSTYTYEGTEYTDTDYYYYKDVTLYNHTYLPDYVGDTYSIYENIQRYENTLDTEYINNNLTSVDTVDSQMSIIDTYGGTLANNPGLLAVKLYLETSHVGLIMYDMCTYLTCAEAYNYANENLQAEILEKMNTLSEEDLVSKDCYIYIAFSDNTYEVLPIPEDEDLTKEYLACNVQVNLLYSNDPDVSLVNVNPLSEDDPLHVYAWKYKEPVVSRIGQESYGRPIYAYGSSWEAIETTLSMYSEVSWIFYEPNTGNTYMDYLYTQYKLGSVKSIEDLYFTPLVPLKAWDIGIDAPSFTTVDVNGRTMQQWLKAFSAKCLGNKKVITQICDSLTTETINTDTQRRSDFAFFFFGVPCNSTNQWCQEYIFKFIQMLYNYSQGAFAKGNISTGITETSDAVGLSIANLHNFTLESSCDFFADATYKLTYAWEGITASYSDETSTKTTYSSSVSDDDYTVSFSEISSEGTKTYTINKFVCLDYILKDFCKSAYFHEEIIKHDMSSDFVIPLEMNIFKGLKLYTQNELPQFLWNVGINVFQSDKVKISWYTQKIFIAIVGIGLIVVTAIVTIFCPPAGAGLGALIGTGLTAIGVAGTALIILTKLLTAIAVMLISIIVRRVVYKITGNEMLAQIAGFAAALYAATGSINMLSSANTQQTISLAMNGANNVLTNINEKTQQEIQSIIQAGANSMQSWQTKINTVNSKISDISSAMTASLITQYTIGQIVKAYLIDPQYMDTLLDFSRNPETQYNATIGRHPCDNRFAELDINYRTIELYKQGVLGKTYDQTFTLPLPRYF